MNTLHFLNHTLQNATSSKKFISLFVLILSGRLKDRTMTKISAFKAIRPAKNKAHLVASREISSYSQEELEEKLTGNPYTFIHIIYPETSETDENRTAPNSPERFNKVKKEFERFLDEGILIQDEEEALYVYRQSSSHHSYLGVIGGASVDEYNSNLIKKHEATITAREEMFMKYLDIVGFNAEPVLLSHQKSEILDQILELIIQREPEYDFTTTDRLTHELWVASPTEVEALQQAYASIEACYIADGHHRSASSTGYYALMQSRPGFSPSKNYNSFLSFFIDEERLDIFPFSRLCKSLNGHSQASFLSKLNDVFSVNQLDAPRLPQALHEFVMYLENEWFSLQLRENYPFDATNVCRIDAEILTHTILSPLLDIHDLKTDENVTFQRKENSIEAVKQSVDSGVYKVGFLLYPVTMEQVKAVADAGEIMPPKSTWVEPKLRSGLTIFKLDE